VPGEYTVKLSIRDSEGDVYIAEPVTITVDLGQAPPRINSISPADHSKFYTADSIIILVDASDENPGDVLEYQYSVQYRLTGDYQILQAWTLSSTFDWATTAVDFGTHNIKVEVRDGNGGNDTKIHQIHIFREPIAPPSN
jgi:hypothetical protein